jgi:hypothetical protein
MVHKLWTRYFFEKWTLKKSGPAEILMNFKQSGTLYMFLYIFGDMLHEKFILSTKNVSTTCRDIGVGVSKKRKFETFYLDSERHKLCFAYYTCVKILIKITTR